MSASQYQKSCHLNMLEFYIFYEIFMWYVYKSVCFCHVIVCHSVCASLTYSFSLLLLNSDNTWVQEWDTLQKILRDFQRVKSLVSSDLS